MRGERVFRFLLLAYPRAFRERYADDLLAFFREERLHPRYGRGVLRPLRFWSATIRDLIRTAASERRPVDRRARKGIMQTLSALLFDVRHAIRSLAGTPAVTATALLVLTLGIGVSTAIFSVVDGVVLRGLPYADEARLVAVNETDTGSGITARQRASLRLAPVSATSAAYQNYVEWAARQDVFEALAASAAGPTLTTADPERPERLRTHRITSNLLDVLGVAPALGPGITPEDERTGAPVALISDELWRRRFNADPGILGRTLAFDGATYTVVGVMPATFLYPVGAATASRIDLWTPLTPGPRDRGRDGGRNYFTRVVGRLAPGVSIEQASARMTQIRDALALEHPRWFEDRGILVRPLKDSVIAATARSWMMMLLAAVAIVFLVACANVANLLLARASGRTREIGVRAAMGATRGQIVRALLVESVLLAVAGAAGGVLLAYWGVDILRAALPASLPRVWLIAVDLRVIALASSVAVATGVLCGLVPALQMSRTDVSAALRSGGRSVTGGGRGGRLREVFLISEVALAAALLVGAGIFASSFIRLVNTDMGFDGTNVLSVHPNPRVTGEDELLRQGPSRVQIQMGDVLARVQALPGVLSAALVAGGVPLTGSWSSQPVRIGDAQWTGADEVVLKQVSPGYFATISAQILAGRDLSASDTRGAQAVVVLNDEAVRRYFGGRDPLGAALVIDAAPPRTVVGVVRGMRLTGPEAEVRPEAYVPYGQWDEHNVAAGLVLATEGPPAQLIPSVKDVVWQVMPGAYIPEPKTMDEMFGELITQRKLNMILLSLFGALALLIATIGVYGVLAYVVEGRRKEIGVRMAMGAVPSRILTMVLSRAAVTIGVGLALGFAVALWLERLVMAFVYQGVARDPMVYGAAALLLVALGLLAAYVPARRAARVDPLVALRAE